MSVLSCLLHRLMPESLRLARLSGSCLVLALLVACGGGGDTAPSLQSIAISPANPVMTAGGSQALVATGHYSDGSTQDLSGTAQWSSSASGVVTVNSTGTLTAVGGGTATITATVGSISGSTSVTVNFPQLSWDGGNWDNVAWQ